ncbi:hypothetical protein APR09_004306 [Nocardia amikacinitolerans]|nr:hypothetical protein [Nocardia amikacinitolerans]
MLGPCPRRAWADSRSVVFCGGAAPTPHPAGSAPGPPPQARLPGAALPPSIHPSSGPHTQAAPPPRPARLGFACQSRSASRPSHLGFACQSRSAPGPPHPEFVCQSRSAPGPSHLGFACQSRSAPGPPRLEFVCQSRSAPGPSHLGFACQSRSARRASPPRVRLAKPLRSRAFVPPGRLPKLLRPGPSHLRFACQNCSGPGLPTSGSLAKVAPAQGLPAWVRLPEGRSVPGAPPRLAHLEPLRPVPYLGSPRGQSSRALARPPESFRAPASAGTAKATSHRRPSTTLDPGHPAGLALKVAVPWTPTSVSCPKPLSARPLLSLAPKAAAFRASITSSPVQASGLGLGLPAGATSPRLTHLTPLHPRRRLGSPARRQFSPALAFRLADLMLRPGFASNQKIWCQARFRGSAAGFADHHPSGARVGRCFPSIARRSQVCSGPPAAPHRVVAAACDSAGLASINRRTDRGNPEDAR